MYIPSSINASPEDSILDLLTSKPSGGLGSEKWSSFIGIVTAICGNILISFALNTQRYAHIRLEKSRAEQHELKKRRQNRKTAGYGTQQAEVAEERSRRNLKAEPVEAHDASETDALIPSVESLDSMRKSSGGSEGPGKLEDEEETEGKTYLKSPIWWLGIAMMTVGEAGNFLAYGFAPASIVSPLGVVALVSNCLIAPLLLRERFRWRDGLGVIIAVAGCVTIVMSASDSNPKLTPDAIWSLITRWEFETYFGITVVLILALSYVSNKFGDKSILIDLGLVGLFGGYTALSTKGVASLLSSEVYRVVTFPITYLLVAVLVFTAVMQIKYVNRALQRFNSTMVIPTQFVLFTISVIVGSAILYRDFERTTTEDAGKFVGGCALTFLGVWFITSGRGDESEEDEEDEEVEDAIDLLDEEGVHQEIRERDDLVDRRSSLIAGSSRDAPQFRRLQTDSSIPSTPASGADTPQLNITESPHRNQPADMSPATDAAIHSASASNIPHAASDSALPLGSKPPMHATTSTPEVPTTLDSRPKTPLRRGQSVVENTSPSKATPSTPQTPRHRPDPQHTDSQRLLNRHSVAGLLPGPLMSPLSSSLSAIVADSLRRGVDHGQPSSARRHSVKWKRKTDANAPPLKRHSIASGEMDFGTEGDAESSRPAGGRVRSLSAALGDMFTANRSGRTGSRGSGVESNEGRDEENGHR